MWRHFQAANTQSAQHTQFQIPASRSTAKRSHLDTRPPASRRALDSPHGNTTHQARALIDPAIRTRKEISFAAKELFGLPIDLGPAVLRKYDSSDIFVRGADTKFGRIRDTTRAGSYREIRQLQLTKKWGSTSLRDKETHKFLRTRRDRR